MTSRLSQGAEWRDQIGRTSFDCAVVKPSRFELRRSECGFCDMVRRLGLSAAGKPRTSRRLIRREPGFALHLGSTQIVQQPRHGND